ncbi:MAG: response regulator [Terriglobia bacterium]
MVLVADDSPTIQKRALGILKGQGFEVETVSNGVAAIKRLAVLHPVVVLADVSMPGRDGYEVCEFVKKSADLSRVPVLLVASDMEPYDNARGEEVGADGLIKKPFDSHELISIVVKFAEQFEAATSAVAAPVMPSMAPESAHEVAASDKAIDDTAILAQPPAESTREFPAPTREDLDYMPTLVQHTAPPAQEFAISSENADYTPTLVQHTAPDFSAAGGVAFAEPALEATPEHPPQAAETEASYAAPQTDAQNAVEPFPPPGFVDAFSTPETQGTSHAEIPFILEEPAPASPSAPSDLPPTARIPSFLEGLEAVTPEPVFVEEQPAQAFEPPTPTRELTTVIFRAPVEITEPVWKDEPAPAPPAPAPAEPFAMEPPVEAPAGSSEVSADHLLEPSEMDTAVSATSLDGVSPHDVAAGEVYFASEAAESAPVEAAQQDYTTAEFAPVEAAAAEVAAVESAPAEVAPAEFAPVEPASAEGPPAETASVDAAVSAPVEEGVAPEIASSESAPEAVSAETIPLEAPAEVGLAETRQEVAAPPPAFDWNLFYTVVHKVVVKMSPPPLPPEAVEELARRLADEIATEIISESSQPPA